MFRASPRGPVRAAESLCVLQLTDTHLYAAPEGCLLGQNTGRTLELVLDLALQTLARIDVVLLTGDLVHDESPEGYRYLAQRMEALGAPCLWLPGNHDKASVMADIFNSGTVTAEGNARESAWNFVLLDSTIPGQDGGHLDSGQLALLEDSLARRPQDPTLVCLHHQAVPVGSAWMDTMALDNPEAFFGIIDRHPQVRCVLWGHIHQEFSTVRNDVQLLGSPSTCVQFLPGSAEFALDALTPGFRWLRLHPDGRFETAVERIATYPDPLVFSTAGY
ncbi:MAG: 3',5'-cyclic-AMP phosphodiesterase [Chromatiaceae bacterium]|nr:3',5'-cyclic-AMP phosphodiesterase [Chromatiaceae bacterium]